MEDTDMTKLILLAAITGHILCGTGDVLLSYSPSGRLDLKGGLKDAARMREVFADLPLSYPLASALLGVFGITLFGFGYLELAKWMGEFSHTASVIMYISSVLFIVPIVVHHVICALVEWFYIRLGRTDEIRDAVFEFQIKTISTTIVGYLGVAVFLVTLFVMIVTGKTSLPQWACVFNTLPLMLIMMPTKFASKGNIAGAVMFLGLLALI